MPKPDFFAFVRSAYIRNLLTWCQERHKPRERSVAYRHRTHPQRRWLCECGAPGWRRPISRPAMLRERSVVRTWCMRGTLHLLAAEDLEWLVPLIGPAIIRASRRRLAEVGLYEEACAKGIRIIRQGLADQGPLSRGELANQLVARGISLKGQATYHLIRLGACPTRPPSRCFAGGSPQAPSKWDCAPLETPADSRA